MGQQKKIEERFERRVRRTRAGLHGTAERPRLSVFRSSQHIYAQVIDDDAGRTLVAATSLEAEVRSELKGGTANKAAAKLVGEKVAERAMAKGIKKVVFDRGGYQYHGKVKELADAARAKGLDF